MTIREISEMATSMARACTRDQVKDNSMPLKLLYDELTKAKEIVPISLLVNKSDYWNDVKDLEASHHKKIWIAQALYIYDLMTQ